jgi:hypothetical protein
MLTTVFFSVHLDPNHSRWISVGYPLDIRWILTATGLRKINISYSRISFEDITKKLALDNAQDAEFICAKAIRDGVIDATIDHAKGWMQSKEITDVNVTVRRGWEGKRIKGFDVARE